MKPSLWIRAAFGLFVLCGVGAILVVGYGPGPGIEREPVPPPDAGPVEQPCSAECRFNQRKQRAIDSCYRRGGVPALGFSFSVVCIEGQVRQYRVDTDEDVPSATYVQ